jgi:hypothetical protein
MKNDVRTTNAINWIFGIIVFAIGVVNTFWGNDPGFGNFLLLLSFVYVPPVNALFREITGFSIHPVIKVVLGIFILWAALGVGELFEKFGMMVNDISLLEAGIWDFRM